MRLKAIAAFAAALLSGTCLAHAETITIATVNNSQMVVMQKLSSTWEQKTGNHINWVVLEENVLRQRVTTDIATHGGQFDIVTLGSYEAPLWGKQGWLKPLDGIADYDYKDVFPSVLQSLTEGGKLYALPFYAESSFTYYRKDLFQAAGLTMPSNPTYAQIDQYAAKLTDKSKQQYGICLRGKPGWGENMAFFDTLLNTYGGEWFDKGWNAQLDKKPWNDALTFYVHLLKDYGPPGASSNGFNENQALFSTGHCAMWIDATSGAGLIYDKNSSQVYDKTAFTAAPVDVTPNGSHWFWAWALAVPATSTKEATAKEFIAWATSKDYINLVGEKEGWTTLPPGTRLSTYSNPDYLKAAPFAGAVKTAIETADLDHPTLNPVPYTGIQYVSIPEFESIGTTVGQLVAAALTGQQTVDSALKQAQASVSSTMEQAGYTQ
ncbi:ABC transporter substrate-binding protein [Acidisoma silvae]|uniref:Sugar ABC transporter substrate-binding protein n=1 Tax=Acidisoma silvae TaxID=2802396 RepID=A0A963YRL4_9PROT|nr:sugar ABC transporter substrate-binding protein [Acidisoma silvae]MCB8875647.1 sugar ABC transporter substrate-binding protein [Acidisoma silvae]